MFVVLSGAHQNAGDYLITERARDLLKRFAPGEELVQFPAAARLDEHLPEINRSRGIIILGGPGCRPNMYPRVYPLAEDLNAIRCPVFLLGSGWKARDASPAAIKGYKYDRRSLALLSRIASTRAGVSVRDHGTRHALRHNGVENVHVTGCPAWYDLECMGRPYVPPTSLTKLCFTPPVSAGLRQQGVAAAKEMAKLLPGVEKYACFHHGFAYLGRSGNEAFFQDQRQLRSALSSLGYQCVDLSGSQAFGFYDDCSIHVGYRVHAHISMLSRRRTSFLLYEDARGFGVNDALGLPGVPGFAPRSEAQRKHRLLAKLKWQRRPGSHGPNPHAIEQLHGLLERELASGFASFRGYPAVIDHYYSKMSTFIENVLSHEAIHTRPSH
ncbi:MAG: polysaccharide pyruvyl transferase family protein [Pirellulales bacterium]